ncbi:Cthe_2314 family HEPN domain-containing protein, partial [Flavobacterium sp. A45]|uniref:Cthe_2314 family HEPN domain-containing protein n=1 Tax=Flavobacterium sp. A45 TaxID=1945862 RepID=UPI0009C4D129
MEITELNEELNRKFFDIINGSVDELYNHTERKSSQSNFHLLSDKGKYSSRVFEYYSKMNQTKEDLRKIEIFLRRFPLKKIYEDNDITHLDYIKYHTEVFYHKINTLLDLFKIIINKVHELGFSEKKCTWENLTKSEKLKQSMLITVVECYYKSFENVIIARNLNTHRGQFYD